MEEPPIAVSRRTISPGVTTEDNGPPVLISADFPEPGSPITKNQGKA